MRQVSVSGVDGGASAGASSVADAREDFACGLLDALQRAATTDEFYSTVTQEHEAKVQWIMEAITTGRTGNTTDARLTSEAQNSPIRRAS